ncbi:MAG TPA: SPOR domain-containing protein [Alphaproteobacteria bacterium]
MDLRNNQDDRPYRMTTRQSYETNQQWNEDESMTTQGYYREVLRNVTEQRWFPLAAVTLGVIVFGSLIAFAYRQGAQTTANATTPLIQAESTPYKEKPQDAGGMDVPFQDAVVFDQLDNSKTADAGDKIENLLPPPEQPVEDPAKVADAATTTDGTKSATETAPPSAPKEEDTDKSVIANATTKTDTSDSVADKIAATEEAMKAKATDTTTTAKEVATTTKTDVAKTETAAAQTIAKTIPAKAEAKTAAPKVATTTVKTEEIAAAPAAKPVTTTATTPAKMNAVAPAAPTPAPVATGGSSKVQLGAFKDEAAARAAWVQFQKQYAPHLNGITPNYARADLGAKGVFYRVQGVNLSKAQAQSICQSINSQKSGACIIPQ